jgi:hypothetical protein
LGFLGFFFFFFFWACELVSGIVGDPTSSNLRGEGEREDSGNVGVTDVGGVNNGIGTVTSSIGSSSVKEDMEKSRLGEELGAAKRGTVG